MGSVRHQQPFEQRRGGGERRHGLVVGRRKRGRRDPRCKGGARLPALGRRAPSKRGRQSATPLPRDPDGVLLIAENGDIEEDGRGGKKEKVRERVDRPLRHHYRTLHHRSALLLAAVLCSSSAVAARCTLVLSDGALHRGSVVWRVLEAAAGVNPSSGTGRSVHGSEGGGRFLAGSTQNSPINLYIGDNFFELVANSSKIARLFGCLLSYLG
jgi:hypothetical protein